MCCVGVLRSILCVYLTVQQDPNTCQNMTNRLAACWAVCNLDCCGESTVPDIGSDVEVQLLDQPSVLGP